MSLVSYPTACILVKAVSWSLSPQLAAWGQMRILLVCLQREGHVSHLRKIPVTNEAAIIEMSAIAKALEAQRSKFRPVQCNSVIAISKLPLHLYLLRDLQKKLEYFNPGKQLWGRCLSGPVGFTRMTVDEFLSGIEPLFSSLKKHLDSAVCLLKEGAGLMDAWSCCRSKLCYIQIAGAAAALCLVQEKVDWYILEGKELDSMM